MEEPIMKKSLLLALAITLCFIGTTTVAGKSWVSTKDGRTNCEQVRIKISKALIILQDGTKITKPLAEIIAYSQDGKVYRKLNLYKNGIPSEKMEFMQLMSVREDYGLFKYYRSDVETPHYCYYVYQGDKLCYSLDESIPLASVLNLFQFFGIKAVVA
jgi:hypothetical protein